ncbi:hypothetical protein BHM03_00020727, partial [Ensete ventricosum]
LQKSQQGRRGGRHGLRLSPLRRLMCGVRARDDGAKLSEAGEGHTLGVAFTIFFYWQEHVQTCFG